MKLYHCRDARSLRPLWLLEELSLDYELINLPFPPRVKQKEFLAINPSGTVPAFEDNGLLITESVAICQYVADKYGAGKLTLPIEHKEYGNYLNWLHRSDTTFTFPQTLVLRYDRIEPIERQQPQIVEDYKKWLYSRLRVLENHLSEHEFLCAEQFTIADICVSYALFLAKAINIDEPIGPHSKDYLTRLMKREAFQRALTRQQNLTLSF